MPHAIRWDPAQATLLPLDKVAIEINSAAVSMVACNSAHWLSTLSSFIRLKSVTKIGMPEPDRFIINPIHQMPEPPPNTLGLAVVD